jgi:hypothetical protein
MPSKSIASGTGADKLENFQVTHCSLFCAFWAEEANENALKNGFIPNKARVVSLTLFTGEHRQLWRQRIIENCRLQ